MCGNRERDARGRNNEDFSFVNSVVKYLLFIFNFIFWLIATAMIAIGVYARVIKHAETALACLAVDPAMMLLVVGVLMFIITFCGCVGSLRENICLLQFFCISLTVIFMLQLAAGVLGFIFSDKARGKVTELVNNAIVHYRDDIDLQNLIDFGQKEFGCCGAVSYTDWSMNMYFNCTAKNPSLERCAVPFSCCITTQEKVEVINTMCGQGVQVVEYIEAGDVIHTNGCIDKVVDWIHSNLFLMGGIAVGLAIPQLVGILLSQILINQIKDQIELQNYNNKHRADPWR
ncbi:tetraspanin-33 isoform X2 [Corythoichthys intestinalis]|uniref:tetraspanin-33 isoform X2 n=2 Tax=Corythoichthys intestinalis TaxID=161448 RepID=UPI0025A68411|nr:tetraspanin-33 isoform X2 [Corythoichthys intestinalis]XP_061809122.1 tetraspanin-33-like [Nerophis lumbriciformis]